VGFGGSEIRPEATGFGVVLFAECALEDAGDKIEGKRCIVSGSGWVQWGCWDSESGCAFGLVSPPTLAGRAPQGTAAAAAAVSWQLSSCVRAPTLSMCRCVSLCVCVCVQKCGLPLRHEAD
jgi:hypothetical protein